ncbi:hypothetical protein PTTG_11184 [Puccinia triticina 1-1 BBBD Race 1]|uniref:Uncharacterized protein n=1 Tax=Puccinia triticina (isolate 1-1 / race 1 (BBBD)) TaxID=630390 RepID=A0A0C4FD80_PUCT1|nr:hypothetical protein PTTG_11184 [Puccinia triticina 1-1 BBBD Race 1]
MITEFTNNHKLDAKDIGEAIFKLHEKIEHLQAQIYDLQNQNYGRQAYIINNSIITTSEERDIITWFDPFSGILI